MRCCQHFINSEYLNTKFIILNVFTAYITSCVTKINRCHLHNLWYNRKENKRKQKKERGDTVVELDNFKGVLAAYKSPLQEVRDSL